MVYGGLMYCYIYCECCRYTHAVRIFLLLHRSSAAVTKLVSRSRH